MVTFGLDISHHQNRSLDLARCKREGISFVILKAGEGNSMVDDQFASNLAEARAAGLIVLAYWFVRANASPDAHVVTMRAVVPKDVPVILDIEKPNSGDWPTKAHCDRVLAAFRGAGYKVPLAYIPLWFWRDYWHSPRLDGWPPLWSSRYPDNRVGTVASEWAQVPAKYWDGYGGLKVKVLQFTSSASIAGHQPLDANAFLGTPQEFAALVGGQSQEEDMSQADVDNIMGYLWRGGPSTATGNTAIASNSVMGRLQNVEGFLFRGGPATRDEDNAGVSPDSVMGRLKATEQTLDEMRATLAEILAAVQGTDKTKV